MKEQELRQYLIIHYPKEDEACEWKEFKNRGIKGRFLDPQKMADVK